MLWLALLVAGVTALFAVIGDARQATSIIRSARWPLLLSAGLIEVAYLLNLALFMAFTFRAAGVPAPLRRFVPLSLASHFVNMVSKTGGMGGIALYTRESRTETYSAQQASAAYLMQHFLGYAAYFFALAATLVLLYVRGSLRPVEVMASAVVVAISGGLAVVGWLAVRRVERIERIMVLAASPINAFGRLLHRPNVVPVERAHEIAAELHETMQNVLSQPTRYTFPFAFALLVELLSAALLFIVAMALHAEISFATALAVYTISLLFSMIAVTPAGLGFVEASMTFLLVSFGLDTPHAVAVTVAFRFFDLWIPMALGAISLLFVYRRGTAATNCKR